MSNAPEMEGLGEPSTSFLIKYVGSFEVIGCRKENEFNLVRENLHKAKKLLHNLTSIVLDVSTVAIRIRSSDSKTIHMVHSLTDLSYATCDPDSCQFAFCAHQPPTVQRSKEPQRHPRPGVQYCHVFSTDSAQQAKEINDFVSVTIRETERTRRNQREIAWREFPVISNQDDQIAARDVVSTSLSSFISNEDRNVAEKLRELERWQSDETWGIIDSQGRSTNQFVEEKASVIHHPENHADAISNEDQTNDFPCCGDKSIWSKHSINGHFTTRDGSNGLKPFGETTDESTAPAFVGMPCDRVHDAGLPTNEERPVEAQLRLESKRRKRRPISAALSTFAGNGKEKTPATAIRIEPTFERNHPVSMFGSVPSAPCKVEEGKNASIFKKLFNLKIGSGSSLRLNLLNDNFSSTIEQNVGADGGRHRSSQSVRFLAANLDRPDPLNDILKTSSKRRRRPLSAVFGNAHSQATNVQNGLALDFPTSSNRIRQNSCNGIDHSPTESPCRTKKLTLARAAVSKMFGFSSSRKKSRSSVYLDFGSKQANALDQSANFERTFRYHQHQPLTKDVKSQRQPRSRLEKDTNGCSPMLGSGAGCGEHCSTSMPNLRNDFEPSLPLNEVEITKLYGAAWFYGNCSRQRAIILLENYPDGAFIVRHSVSQPSPSLVLSLRVPIEHNPSGISHYLILHTAKGFRLKGFTKNFPSVHALVTHHSFMAEQLPCRLVFTDRLKQSSPVIFDHHYQVYQQQKRMPLFRHSSPFISTRHDLLPVTEEESIYGRLPSPPPPPIPPRSPAVCMDAKTS